MIQLLSAEILHFRILHICWIAVTLCTSSAVRNIHICASVFCTCKYCNTDKTNTNSHTGPKQSASVFASVQCLPVFSVCQCWVFASVERLYGSGVEAVLKSVCPWYDGPKVSTRGLQVQQMMSRVGWVVQYAGCSTEAARVRTVCWLLCWSS